MNIVLMQGFAGLSLFSVLLLMALGLAIIFGQMGVINMAHGEFMTIGAYTIYLCSTLTEKPRARFQPYYFLRDRAAFVHRLRRLVARRVGLIRHLYKRPLDTLLATWGLSLACSRLPFDLRRQGSEPTLPDWLMGSWASRPRASTFRSTACSCMGSLLVTGGVMSLHVSLALGPAGARHRAEPHMADAVGINTRKVDRLTFAIGCGIAGVAGAAFTTIGSTGPTSGSLYIVDTFLVVVFGGAASLLGTVASAFGIAQTQSIRSSS
jgi:urea transport system permease protein